MQITVEPSRALCSRHGMRLLVAVVQLFIAPRGFFDENAKEGGMYRSILLVEFQGTEGDGETGWRGEGVGGGTTGASEGVDGGPRGWAYRQIARAIKTAQAEGLN